MLASNQLLARERLLPRSWTFFTLGVFVALATCAWKLYQYIVDPRRRVPGPYWAKFSRFWLLRDYASGKHHINNITLHDRYGPIVRIAPNQFSVNDPASIRAIYGHGAQFKKSDWYTPWGDPKWENMFNVLDPATHSAMRRKLASAYSLTSLVAYEPYVNDCVKKFREHLDEAAQQSTTLNMFSWLRCYAFDVIGMITFSHRLGFLDHGRDEMGFMQALDEINPMSAYMGVFPFIWPIFLGMGKLFGMTGPKGLQSIMEYADARITEVQKNPDAKSGTGPLDFISKLSTSEASSRQDMRGAANANMLAGSDTTSITLTAILYHILKNPVVYKTVQEEIDSAVAEGRVSNPVTFKEAQALPYLQAVIKEGIRVHPATGWTMPRVVPKGGGVFGGHFLPEGAVVGVNAWVVHANESIWGRDARTYNPDRWLSGKESLPAEAFFMSFGQGSRTCIGKNISLLEISKLLPELLRHYTFELDKSFTTLDTESVWFTMPRNLPCKIFKRSAEHA
ncbi:Cytochrome P450-like protein 8 [Elsinoe fawcettii]|nr:Cytochrome P450-like protein 8 [Elsinoe fawcettii]